MKNRDNKEAMTANRVPHMNAGDGKNSYANNSGVQKVGIMRTKSMIDGALESMWNSNELIFPECFRMADLGCSSGPNTLFLISSVIDTIERLSFQKKRKVSEFQVFLNDVPENDFGNLFKLLPDFYEELEQKETNYNSKCCFISGVPGSFYASLFPTNTLHFVHSSYSVHWLSQVPEGLENNKGKIYISPGSPGDVLEAYLKQYQRDFSNFLSLRAAEIVPGGTMVLMFICREYEDPATRDDTFIYTLLAKSLLDLVAEGLVEEADVDAFNVPIYAPYKEEVKAVIEKEGSFELKELQVFQVNWDASGECSESTSNIHVFDKNKSAKIAAGYVRAFVEPMLASHFGRSVMDHLFERFTTHMAEHLCGQRSYTSMTISLTRK